MTTWSAARWSPSTCMYADCEGICPMATENLLRVQELLGERAGRDVFMYSITLQPEHDSPDVLKHYAEMHGVKPGWLFLTGAPADVRALRYRLGFYDPDPRVDGDRETHTGMVRIGNDLYDRWTMAPSLGGPDPILATINHVDRAVVHTGLTADPNRHPFDGSPCRSDLARAAHTGCATYPARACARSCSLGFDSWSHALAAALTRLTARGALPIGNAELIRVGIWVNRTGQPSLLDSSSLNGHPANSKPLSAHGRIAMQAMLRRSHLCTFFKASLIPSPRAASDPCKRICGHPVRQKPGHTNLGLFPTLLHRLI